MKIQLQNGFTLIELMVAFMVVAILITVVAPSMRETIQANRTEKNAEVLYTSMITARSEAVSRNQDVILCKSPTGIYCSTADDWEDGWLIFIDADGDGVKDIADPVASVVPGLQSGFTLRSGSAYSQKMHFKPDGSVTEIGTFSLCAEDLAQEKGRSVILNITGRPRSKNGASICP